MTEVLCVKNKCIFMFSSNNDYFSFIFVISEDESEIKNLVASKKCRRFLLHLRRTNDGGKEEMEGQI